MPSYQCGHENKTPAGSHSAGTVESRIAWETLRDQPCAALPLLRTAANTPQSLYRPKKDMSELQSGILAKNLLPPGIRLNQAVAG